jgi:hypothetical protein
MVIIHPPPQNGRRGGRYGQNTDISRLILVKQCERVWYFRKLVLSFQTFSDFAHTLVSKDLKH